MGAQLGVSDGEAGGPWSPEARPLAPRTPPPGPADTHAGCPRTSGGAPCMRGARVSTFISSRAEKEPTAMRRRKGVPANPENAALLSGRGGPRRTSPSQPAARRGATSRPVRRRAEVTGQAADLDVTAEHTGTAWSLSPGEERLRQSGRRRNEACTPVTAQAGAKPARHLADNRGEANTLEETKNSQPWPPHRRPKGRSAF